jgi:outer membrane protein assembly factor BamB
MERSRLAVMVVAVYLTAAAMAYGGESVKATVADRTGAPTTAAAVPELQLRWTHHFHPTANYGPGRLFDPLLSGPALYVASGDTLFAFDAATGRERWHTALAESVQSQPLAIAGTVAVLTSKDTDSKLHLTGCDAASGKKAWTVEAKAGSWGDGFPLASTGALIYFQNSAGDLYAVDSKLGKLVWSRTATRDQNMGAYPVVAAESVLWNDGNLSALEAKTGAVRWTVDCRPRYVGLYGADARTALLTTASSNAVMSEVVEECTLRAIDLETGRPRWQAAVHGAFGVENGVSAVANGMMLICQRNKLIARDVDTGWEVWTDEAGFWPSASSVRTDGATVCVVAVPPEDRASSDSASAVAWGAELAIGGEGGVPVLMRALDLRTGKLLWERRGKGPFYPVTVRDGSVYVYDEGQRVLALDARSGEPKWQSKYAPTRGDSFSYDGGLVFGEGMLFIVVGHDIRVLSAPGLRPIRHGDQSGPTGNIGQ